MRSLALSSFSLLAVMVYTGSTVVSLSSCKKEQDTPACDTAYITYDTHIKSIINSKCSISNCHGQGSSKGGISTTSYASLQSILNNGKFEQEVITSKSMPENSSLSTTDYELMICWMNDGYPEKP